MHALTAARVISAGGEAAVVALLVALHTALPPGTDVAAAPAVTDARMSDAALFPRLLAAAGARVDERQIFDSSVLGVYFAHMLVWQQVPPNETWLVLEDDAVVPNPELLAQQLSSVLGTGYDLVNLAPNHPPLGSTPSDEHAQLRECPRHDPACVVIGTLAYLVTHEGAQKLLAHAVPPEVAVDWYVSSVRDYLDASFTLAFAAPPLLLHPSGRRSTIDHRCFLCKLPRDELRFVGVTTLCAVLLFVAGFGLRDVLGPLPLLPAAAEPRDVDAPPAFAIDDKAV